MKKNVPSLPTISPGTYRHNKTGNLYEVIGIALHSEEESPMVVYKPLYEATFEYCVRPYESFTAQVNLDGITKPRFEKID